MIAPSREQAAGGTRRRARRKNMKIISSQDFINWDIVAQYMDDDTREEVHAYFAPCTEEEFLTEYLRRAPHDLVIG